MPDYINESSRLWIEEESLKEKAYEAILKKTRACEKQVAAAKRVIDFGDSKEAFMAHSAHTHAVSEMSKVSKECVSLYEKPYFAHLEIVSDDGDAMSVFLSDNPDLERNFDIDGSNQFIVPFKQSKEAPMLTALFHQYQIQRTGSFSTDVHGFHNEFSCNLIRDVEIQRRVLSSVIQVAPEAKGENGQIDVDELLAKRLEENRANVKLRNIIATLQRQQFEIIRTGADLDFVVQGCAGSGKTQCLIHRLFFLRDVLGDNGWSKVLLITPTQLFRNYSMNLMRRYHLSNVNNCSLSYLYYDILLQYDSRFRNRQYSIEYSEEYLPDEYLQKVYDRDTIERVNTEIRNAIVLHAQKAGNLLGAEIMSSEITADYLRVLLKQIEKEIEEFDKRSKVLSRNPEYADRLASLDKLDKQLASLRKKLANLEETHAAIEKEKETFDSMMFEIKKAEQERTDWRNHNKQISDDVVRRWNAIVKSMQNPADKSVHQFEEYLHALAKLIDKTEEWGKQYQQDQEFSKFLDEYCHVHQQKLADFLGGQSEKTWLHRYNDKLRANDGQQKNTADMITVATSEIEQHSEWIQNYISESASVEQQRKTYRSELTKSKSVLGSIESSIFDDEVWNVLEPIKMQYGIKTFNIEQLPDGHQKQTKILYKSDLLFYLEIYRQLYKEEMIPEYSLICVDEGQDLHAADYKMLRGLFPHAAFNIFGDTAQALHSNCGVSNWKEATGIPTVFEMNSNYRNTSAIVDFCNNRFGCAMVGFGAIRDEQKPAVLRDARSLKKAIESRENVVIVKDRREFEHLCSETGLSGDLFDYLDTNSGTNNESKISCYSIFAAKGLEFQKVIAYTRGMNNNQKIVACTRAMERLVYFQ